MTHGMNGQMKDKAIDANGNHYTAEFWEYDAQIGRRWNRDIIDKPWMSDYAALGNNPIYFIDPNGADWYRNKKSGNIDWFDGSSRHKGYKHMGVNFRTQTDKAGVSVWYGKSKDEEWQEKTLDNVTVTAKGARNDNSLMESMLQVSNVTKASMEEYNARPLPSYYDANPLKTVFWNSTIGALNPIKDVDAYVSASIKNKTDLKTFSPNLNGASTTVVWFGLQGGITTRDNQGLYGNMITGDNSYISYKNSTTGTEIRALPFRGLGVGLSNKGPIYGEYSPQLRVLQDTKLRIYGIPIQAEIGMGKSQNPTIGIRGKLESPTILNYNAEVTGGVRFSLKIPDVISAMFQ